MGLLSKWIESLDYEYEIVPLCTRYVSPRSKCEKCASTCPTQAISIKKGKPVINHKKCTECGHCISACPTQAIVGVYPRRTVMRNHLMITDEKLPTKKELLLLYKKGIKSIVYEETFLFNKWLPIIEETNEILKKLEEEPFQFSLKSFKKEESISRRELFSYWKNQSKSVVKQATPAKWRFNQGDLHLPMYYIDYQFFNIIIDIEKCRLCAACEKLCKNNCVKIEKELFTINLQNCTGCELCVDCCPYDALKIEEGIWKVEKRKYSLYEHTCHSCGNAFHSLNEKGTICVACETRKKFQAVRG